MVPADEGKIVLVICVTRKKKKKIKKKMGRKHVSVD